MVLGPWTEFTFWQHAATSQPANTVLDFDNFTKLTFWILVLQLMLPTALSGEHGTLFLKKGPMFPERGT